MKSSPDRGRNIALGVLGGLMLVGGLLILRGGHGGDESSAGGSSSATPTNADLPAASASAATAAPDSGASVAAGGDAGTDSAPRPPPVWRVGSLESDPGTEVLRGTLGKHTLVGALSAAGLPRNEIHRITRATDNFHRIDRGGGKDAFVVARDRKAGTVTAFEFIASPTDVWQARAPHEGAVGDDLTIKKLELFVEKKRSLTAVAITGDLKQAITTAGLREEAIDEIDDALGGHEDTAVIKPGVRLRVVGSEEWVEGAFSDYRVDAIEYVPKTGAPLRLYFYERDASVDARRRTTPHPGYYDAKGQEPFRGTFRSPVPLARITSRFNPKRMHPVLHTIMPHNGVDFGATTGTPVYAASAGTIQSAGDSGPCGNMVSIEHANGLSTAYCHLSKFAAGLHPGQHVEARQLVGYVGATGRVTGPHLHFAVKRGGTFIDPMALKMDGVRTLPPADREAFAKRRAELDAALDGVALPAADPSADEPDKDDPAGEETDEK